MGKSVRKRCNDAERVPVIPIRPTNIYWTFTDAHQSKNVRDVERFRSI